MKTSDSIEVSSARRHHRVYRSYRHYGYRPYYGHRHYGYYRGYNAYGYDPYDRPYYRPGLSVGVGPFGFGLGFWFEVTLQRKSPPRGGLFLRQVPRQCQSRTSTNLPAIAAAAAIAGETRCVRPLKP